MLLSVVVPVYNAEKYVSRCLDCLLHQDLAKEEYEILVMDDGSFDTSYSILKGFADRNDNIHLFQQKNVGPYAARNILLEKVRGEYVYLMDADDLIAFNALGTLVRLAKRLSLDVVSFNSLVTADTKDFQQHTYFNEPIKPEVFRGYRYFEENPFFRLEVWWYLVKTSFLKKQGLRFDENEYNRDVLFTLKTFANAKRVVHVPVTLHCYFQSESSIMRNKDLDHRRILIDSLYTMIHDFTRFISELEMSRVAKAGSVIQNLQNRRDAFVFFFLGKLVRSDLNASQAKVYLRKLKEIKAYPLKSPDPNAFSLLKIIAVNVLNREYFLIPAIELTTIQYNLRKSA